MENKMFCYQCQETAGNKGCTICGVCGKKPEIAAMQDLLVYVTKGIGAVATRLRAEGKNVSSDVNHRITQNLFVTITNANFDREAIIRAIEETLAMKAELIAQLGDTSNLPDAALWSGCRNEFDVKISGVCANSSPTGSRDLPLISNTQTHSFRTMRTSMPSFSGHWLQRWTIRSV